MKDFLLFSDIKNDLEQCLHANKKSEDFKNLESLLGDLNLFLGYLINGDDTFSYFSRNNELYAPDTLLASLLKAEFNDPILNTYLSTHFRSQIEKLIQNRKLVDQHQTTTALKISVFFSNLFCSAIENTEWNLLIQQIIKNEQSLCLKRQLNAPSTIPLELQMKILVLHQICHKLIANQFCDNNEIYLELCHLSKLQFPIRLGLLSESNEMDIRSCIRDPFNKRTTYPTIYLHRSDPSISLATKLELAPRPKTARELNTKEKHSPDERQAVTFSFSNLRRLGKTVFKKTKTTTSIEEEKNNIISLKSIESALEIISSSNVNLPVSEAKRHHRL